MPRARLVTWNRENVIRLYDPEKPRPDGRQGQLYADSPATADGPDEWAEIVDLGDGTIAVRYHGKYWLCITPSGNIELRLERRGWERFRWVSGLDGGRAIRSVDFGHLFRVEGGGGSFVNTAIGYDQAGPWETTFPTGLTSGVIGGLHGQIRRIGTMGVGDDRGPQSWVYASRFYHLWAMREDPARVDREQQADAAVGIDADRVMLQVGSLDPTDYWAGRVADQNWPNHSELVDGLCQKARANGIRLAVCLMGKGNGMDRQSNRLAYVRRMAGVLKDHGDVVLFVQMMNEPYANGYCRASDLLECEAAFRSIAPNLITSTGAHGDPDFEGWRGHPSDAWGVVGTPHLARDTDKSEMQDRPWRQPWDWGLMGRPWASDEPIGPWSSVAEERRAHVLRSHALVTFISRGFGYCYHPDQGIRGYGDMADAPGYREVAAAKRFLPAGLQNGQPNNTNSNFPDRHWDLPAEYLRAGNGNTRGIVRCYGVHLDGRGYYVPFGPVSDFELTPRRPMRVDCYQQDVNDRLWSREVGAGERVTFSRQLPDYLLVSTPL